MAELSVVRRYARALFDTAQRSQSIQQVEDDLKGVDQTLRGMPQLQRILRAPTIAGPRKRELAEKVFGTRVSPLTLRFVTLVIDRRRESVLSQVYPEFRRLANAARNLLPVEVTSAVPLTDPERDALVKSLTARTGKSIQLQASVDPELLGGMVVRMGDTIIDGSVRAKLRQLRAHLTGGRTG
jgi:F-type H+-transporting ATPase subunit delta